MAAMIPKENSNLSILGYFTNKTLLISGTTGFLGKVILEKILRDIPDIKRIYVLIRPKKKFSPQERLKREIFASPLFERLKNEISWNASSASSSSSSASASPSSDVSKKDAENCSEKARSNKKYGNHTYESYVESKVIPISGDVSKENLGIGQAELEELKESVQAIIHCAATVEFQERLDQAIRLNIFGPLRVLELAKDCRRLQSFVHVSTAYANSNLPEGPIEERLYPMHLDPEQVIKMVLDIEDPKEIEKITPNLIKNYPNTYTFTKSIAEHLLVKYRNNVPLAICRPTMIGASLKEPEPGWVDAVSAAGAVFLVVGLGYLSIMPGDVNKIGDHVPVDFVSNAIIMISADIARLNSNRTLSFHNFNPKTNSNTNGLSKQSEYRIYHSGTSTTNPMKWKVVEDNIAVWWVQHKPKKSVGRRASFKMYPRRRSYMVSHFFRYGLLSRAYEYYAKAIDTKFHNKMAQDLKKLSERVLNFGQQFGHFTCNEWLFSSGHSLQALALLSPEELEVFGFDAKDINWDAYVINYCYGLHRHVLKENVTPPFKEYKTCIIRKDPSGFFSDIFWAFSTNPKLENTIRWHKKPRQIKELVIMSPKVKAAIKSTSLSEGIPYSKAEQNAKAILDAMVADLHVTMVRVLAWFFRKVWKTIYQSITVDQIGLDKVCESNFFF